MDKRTVLTRRLAIVTAIGMFIVLLMGANVTATGSGDGCGNDWPLCHGKLIPGDYFESIVEYSHRLVTSIEGVAVLATTVLGWGLRKKFPELLILIPAMAFTLVLQSLMGAAAVKWPQSAAVMATHFGISLICLASAYLIARILVDHERERLMRIARVEPTTLLRWLMVANFFFSIIVAYSGAYVRHTHTEVACGINWPDCNGTLAPDLGNQVWVHMGHRVLAVLITITIAWMFVVASNQRETRPDLYALARNCVIVVVLQVLAGGLVVLTTVQLLTTLTHAALMAILFMFLADGVRRVYPMRRSQERTDSSPVSPLGSQRPAVSGPGR